MITVTDVVRAAHYCLVNVHGEVQTMSRKKGERVLTSREREIVRLIIDGKTNRQMAAELKLSVNTVRAHRANIMAAVGIRKSIQLVVYAMRTGLVVPPGSSGVGVTTP